MNKGGAQKVVNSNGSPTIAVASTGTVYTKAFPLHLATFFGIWIKATSASGTPNVKVELEQSYTLPATEGSSDGNYIEPDGFDDIFSSINDEIAHIKTVTPVPMSYGRYKITGISTNPADTTVEIYNFLQESV